MLPTTVAPPRASPAKSPPHSSDSLFERVDWLYAFCRERLFRDDTERIISTLWNGESPTMGTKVIELGCGPGFYSRKLARRFPGDSVTGVDRSRSNYFHAVEWRITDDGDQSHRAGLWSGVLFSKTCATVSWGFRDRR